VRHWWLGGMTDQYIATWQTGDKAGVQTGDKAGGQTGDEAGGQTGGQTGDEAWVGSEDEAGAKPGTRPDQAGERGPEAGGYNEGPEAGGYNGGSEAPRRLGPPMSTREFTG